MSIFEIDPLHDRRWNSFVEHHPHSSVFHRPQWLQALKLAYGYEPVAISTCSPDSLLTNALVFCRVRSALTGNRLVSLPFSDHCELLTSSADQTDSLICHMKGMVNHRKWRYFETRSVSTLPGMEAPPGTTYVFHRLDLRRSEDELFKSFHKDCVQRKIRRAARESLQYEKGRSETHLAQFYTLQVMTRRRQNLPPQPLKWFRSLIDSLGDRLSIRVALKDGIPIASILTLCHGKTVTYKYGCSDARFSNLGGTALLFWMTIKEAKADGFEELDLGRSDAGDAGLVAFKDRWGAQKSTITYCRYPVAGECHQQGWSMRIIRNIVPVIPDKPLAMAGKFLYRHIG
jgi:lipid II:glycine glycyltransferase (peptidoglycan interpeptide bridge formation enzyme)